VCERSKVFHSVVRFVDEGSSRPFTNHQVSFDVHATKCLKKLDTEYRSCCPSHGYDDADWCMRCDMWRKHWRKSDIVLSNIPISREGDILMVIVDCIVSVRVAGIGVLGLSIWMKQRPLCWSAGMFRGPEKAFGVKLLKEIKNHDAA
jgi:hypothetical protein